MEIRPKTIDAAVRAAPYVHPKLAALDLTLSGPNGGPVRAIYLVSDRPMSEERHFGVTPPSVHQMILTLERAGLIRQQPDLPRSIEVLVPPEKLPVLKAISNRSKPL